MRFFTTISCGFTNPTVISNKFNSIESSLSFKFNSYAYYMQHIETCQIGFVSSVALNFTPCSSCREIIFSCLHVENPLLQRIF